MLKCHAAGWSLRASPLNWALCSFWGNKKPAFSAGFRICFIEQL
ncbi:acetyltransferase [Vibrio cholerae]|nr:acetyltransferase [Vibrio cholerae]EGR0319891.1 acetyltransferase [Vibrio cholerae]EGR0578683.1 acetyltransferase [Vibrio cholerae]EGR1087446.1 acetyltransferase [Vibrio cholerae]